MALGDPSIIIISGDIAVFLAPEEEKSALDGCGCRAFCVVEAEPSTTGDIFSGGSLSSTCTSDEQRAQQKQHTIVMKMMTMKKTMTPPTATPTIRYLLLELLLRVPIEIK